MFLKLTIQTNYSKNVLILVWVSIHKSSYRHHFTSDLLMYIGSYIMRSKPGKENTSWLSYGSANMIRTIDIIAPLICLCLMFPVTSDIQERRLNGYSYGSASMSRAISIIPCFICCSTMVPITYEPKHL